MTLPRAVIVLVLAVWVSAAAAAPPAWIAAWATSMQSGTAYPRSPIALLDQQTVRERVRVSLAGARIRLRLSNEFGTEALHIGAATVAHPVDRATVAPGSIRDVTFDGRAAATIPPGAAFVSDAIEFPVTPGQEISISLYFPGRASPATLHEISLKRAVVSPHGDMTHADTIAGGTTTTSAIGVSAVLVPVSSSSRLVVALGDSITDGVGSTLDADRGWPSDLARRLAQVAPCDNVAVVNAGIAGNRLLADCLMVSLGCSGVNALARFDRDVLALPGVTHVIVAEGINDLGFPGARVDGGYLAGPALAPSTDDVIAAYRQLIERAHAHGVRALGATLTPFEGVDMEGYYSPAKETARQTINAWIRTSGAFDGVVDFDAVLRDPAHPSRILPRFASKDHLHPNDEGYQAMADAIDVALFA